MVKWTPMDLIYNKKSFCNFFLKKQETRTKFLDKRESWLYILNPEKVFTKGQKVGGPMLQIMPLGIAEGFPCKTEWAEAEVVAIDLFMPAQPT